MLPHRIRVLSRWRSLRSGNGPGEGDVRRGAHNPSDDCPGLTATTAHGKVVASRQEAALN